MNWYQKNTTEIDEQFMTNLLRKRGPWGYLVFQEVRAFLGKKDEFQGGEVDVNAIAKKLQLWPWIVKWCLLYIGSPACGKFILEDTGRKDRYFVTDPYLVKIADDYTKKRIRKECPDKVGQCPSSVRTKSDNVRPTSTLHNNTKTNTKTRGETEEQTEREIDPIIYFINTNKTAQPKAPPLILNEFEKKDLTAIANDAGEAYQPAVDWFFDHINEYTDDNPFRDFKKDINRILRLSTAKPKELQPAKVLKLYFPGDKHDNRN